MTVKQEAVQDADFVTVKQEAEAPDVFRNESWRTVEGFGPWILQVYNPGPRTLYSSTNR